MIKIEAYCLYIGPQDAGVTLFYPEDTECDFGGDEENNLVLNAVSSGTICRNGRRGDHRAVRIYLGTKR